MIDSYINAINSQIATPHSQTKSKESFEDPPLITAMLTYLGFYLLMILGYINQLFFIPKVATEKNRDGYVPLYDSFERFYLRYVYRRVKDCWNRPICSVPGDTVVLKDRITKDFGWTFELVLKLCQLKSSFKLISCVFAGSLEQKQSV